MKKIKIILIIGIILNVLLTVLFFVRKNADIKEQTSKINEVTNEIVTDNKKELPSSKIENLSYINKKYTGDIAIYYLEQNYNFLIEKGFYEIYSDTKNLKTEAIEKYLKDNKSSIEVDFGINKSTEFKKLVKLLSIYKDNNLKYEKAVIDEMSYLDEENYVSFNINIIYNTADINLKIYLSKKNNIETPIIQFIPIS